LDANAQAIHPGYGFLAESASFAQQCADAGLVFVGPPPETLELLGDKVAARRMVRRLGLAVIPGTDSAAEDDELLSSADSIGYPVLLKAAAGGGGIGIRAASSRKEMAESIPTARREARSAFGDDSLYVESLMEKARHIEVQLLADNHGHTIHLRERECSIQRRHQKLIEEAPARVLDEPLRRRICRAAVRIARASGYRGAGTVEFLLDAEGNFFFMEVNPRLQVEHTVTEAITGVDIVKEQLRIAAGRELAYTQKDIRPRGWALECRILAEDPVRDFAPCVGKITKLREPGGPGVRVDSGICEGLTISPHYDSLLAKLIVWGESRGVAIVRMRRALEEYQILGVTTNLELHRALLNSHRFFGGQFHTSFLEDQFAPLPTEEDEDLLAAALTTVLLDWRRRSQEQGNGTKVESSWKLLGRWDMQRGG
jgi:acetyl/propionyl-CoA carboxylase alpha subunit